VSTALNPFSGTVAVPFTAGASAWIVPIGITAAGAGTAQCRIGAYRTFNEAFDPDTNDALDNSAYHNAISTLLDAVSLLGAGASGLTTFKLLKASKAATGKAWHQLLKGLSRQERSKLTKELMSLQDPRLTAKQLKLAQAARVEGKRFTATQIRHATLTQIKDSAGAFLGVVGSASSGNLHSMGAFAVGLYEEVE